MREIFGLSRCSTATPARQTSTVATPCWKTSVFNTFICLKWDDEIFLFCNFKFLDGHTATQRLGSARGPLSDFCVKNFGKIKTHFLEPLLMSEIYPKKIYLVTDRWLKVC